MEYSTPSLTTKTFLPRLNGPLWQSSSSILAPLPGNPWLRFPSFPPRPPTPPSDAWTRLRIQVNRPCPLQSHPRFLIHHLPILHPRTDLHNPTPHTTHVPLAFASRADYAKLIFSKPPSVDMKFCWPSDVTRTLNLDQELAEVKMLAVTSRFVYIP